ncbi:ABC transporter ATP-binding protein [Cryptosporangium minutisporangium]|uniref:ABC transporter ATP-binding protein n=1 Tax=Cryptosporangium minutisporangium TaxID=113569 RepID=A0ABP6T2J8_9ACTN
MRLQAHALDLAVRTKRLVVSATLDAPSGSFVGLVGPNGSGKTSLLRLLAGLSRPDSGRILLDDVDRATLSRRALARRVAYVGQHTAPDADLTVRDVLLLARIPHRALLAPVTAADHEAVDDSLDRAGLSGYGPRDWASLSGGEQQRVNIARALLQRPDVLLLDEPTNHLDIRHQLELLDDLARSPLTVVAALHGLDLAARFCDRLVLLDAGRVVAAGPPVEVLTPERIAAVFGVAADVTLDEEGRPLLRWYRLPLAGATT